jgi:hypothetical protein
MPGLVREAVRADDRLVRADRRSREHGRRAPDASGITAGSTAVCAAEGVGPDAQRHHDLFERRVAGTARRCR